MDAIRVKCLSLINQDKYEKVGQLVKDSCGCGSLSVDMLIAVLYHLVRQVQSLATIWFTNYRNVGGREKTGM